MAKKEKIHKVVCARLTLCEASSRSEFILGEAAGRKRHSAGKVPLTALVGYETDHTFVQVFYNYCSQHSHRARSGHWLTTAIRD